MDEHTCLILALMLAQLPYPKAHASKQPGWAKIYHNFLPILPQISRSNLQHYQTTRLLISVLEIKK
jgi:hypothetical protein